MRHIWKTWIALALLLIGFGSAARAADFGILVCDPHADGGPTTVLSQFVDDNGGPSPRGATLTVNPVGRPCATVVAELLQGGWNLEARTPISLCETGPCPNPPPKPTVKDCLIWDIGGSDVYALIGCDPSAVGGPKVILAQSAGGTVPALLADTVGMGCAAFMKAFLSEGGQILGRAVVALPFPAQITDTGDAVPGPKFRPLQDKILIEVRRDNGD